MDEPVADGQPEVDALVPENDLDKAYRLINEALAPMPVSVAMPLLVTILADVLILQAMRSGMQTSPSKLASVGRDGLFTAICARLDERRQGPTLGTPASGGIA